MISVEFIIVTFRKTTDFSGDEMWNTYIHTHAHIYMLYIYYKHIIYMHFNIYIERNIPINII